MANLITTARAQQNAALANAPTALLANLIAAASGAIENYCGRTFASTSYTEDLDGNDLDWIYVENRPITSLTNVIITEVGGSTETITSTYLDYDGTSGKVWFIEGGSGTYDYFPKGHFNVRVTYTGGYSTVPDAVQEACSQLCAQLYGQSADSKNPSLQSESLGDYSYTRMSGTASGELFGPAGNLIRLMLQPYVVLSF